MVWFFSSHHLDDLCRCYCRTVLGDHCGHQMLIAEGDTVDMLTANAISETWDMCLEQVRAVGRHCVFLCT